MHKFYFEIIKRRNVKDSEEMLYESKERFERRNIKVKDYNNKDCE